MTRQNVIAKNRSFFTGKSRFPTGCGVKASLLPSLFLACGIFLSCDKGTEAVSDDHDGVNDTAVFNDTTYIYVAPGGNGDGSVNAPLGSIQSALDMIDLDSELTGVNVAIGTYNESIKLTTGAHIRGGLDPSADWQPSIKDSTKIHGEKINGYNIALLVLDVETTVVLEGLCIVSPDADTEIASSYGLYFLNCTDVQLKKCLIRSGNGGKGVDGAPGNNSENGDNGWATSGGLIPFAGGHGGSGAYGSGWVTECGGDGGAGYCEDGTPSGGAAGIGGCIGGGGTGSIGLSGQNGVNGTGGSKSLLLSLENNLYLIISQRGENGNDGESGCGGGGGGGGAAPFGNSGFECCGPWGGGGGAGARAGKGGSAGNSGGSSVNLFCIESSITLDNVKIEIGNGGNGGKGGTGGTGGRGGIGATGEFYPPYHQFSGGHGGNGGDGGDGGHGGGGAGGASIGILSVNSTANVTSIAYTDGSGGLGGSSAGNSGQNGLSVRYHQMSLK